MAILGSKWLPRKIARLLYDTGWKDADNLLQMIGTVLAESGGYEWAFHWNDPKDGGNGSTDWGMFQLNDGNVGGSAPTVGSDGKPIPSHGGKRAHADLVTFANKALDPTTAAGLARSMYESRGFEPWYGHYNPFTKVYAWKSHLDTAAGAIANMLREMYGEKVT